ncbi:glycosyltransferase [Azotosporobacter soli]|uniref:glycosyltransferase n=1 Tax=Azotosporobacter soli TaxID=3055040 RepID=UPI0031FE6F1E
MNILLFAGGYHGYGSGNILRCYELCKYINENVENSKAVISGNHVGLINKLLHPFNSATEYIVEIESKYDVIIYDSPICDVVILKKLRQCGSRLIALDFFNYENQEVDEIINLCDQNRDARNQFSGRVYEGVKYAIIKESILNCAVRNSIITDEGVPRVLVTFGGEDPSANTELVVAQLCQKIAKVTVLLGALNENSQSVIEKYSKYKQIEFIQFDPLIAERLAQTDILICGGGTTLLEGIFIGMPIIAVGQNIYENRFIDSIKAEIKLYLLEELSFLLNNFGNVTFREKTGKTYRAFVDGGGKKRITDIIFNRRS